MTDLKELVHVLDGYKLRQIEILTRAPRPDAAATRYKVMFHAIAEGVVKTEAEAAHLLQMEAQGRPFRRFLLEFRRRLFAPLLFLDTQRSPHFNSTQKATFECLRQLATFQTLLYRHCPENARMLAEEILEIALQHDATLVALEMATYLKRYYVERHPDREKYQHYRAQVERLRFDWRAEHQALEAYQSLVAPAVKIKSAQIQIAEKAKGLLKGLLSLKERCNTLMFLSGYHATKYLGEMAKFHWNGATAACDEAIAELNQKTCGSPRIMGVFKVHKVICLTMLDRFEEALALNSEVIEAEIEGTRNWFLYLDNQLLVALKATAYAIALDTAMRMYRNKNFVAMSEPIKESWSMLSAYLVLAHRQGVLSTKLNLEQFLNFRLSKFLNEVPNYTKDKKGLNVPILIAQFLFLLQAQAYDQAHERLISLRKYRLKHFNAHDGYYRTQLFIRMLCSMVGTSFSKKLFLKKSLPLIGAISQIPKGHPDQHFKIEIIPYETLWQWIVDWLDH